MTSITNPISFKIAENTSLGVSSESTPAWRTVELQQGLIRVPNTTQSRLSKSRWWGGHPVHTYPVGTRCGTPYALCMLSLRLLLCALLPSPMPGVVCFFLIYLHLLEGCPAISTHPVGSCFRAPPTPFARTVPSYCTSLAVPRSWDTYRRRLTIRHVAW